MDILKRIDELMQERGWNINQLAEKSGCKYNTIKNLFERNNIPSYGTLEKICSAFGISYLEFFGESTEVVLTQEQKEVLDFWNSQAETLSIEQKKSLIQLFIKSL